MLSDGGSTPPTSTTSRSARTGGTKNPAQAGFFVRRTRRNPPTPAAVRRPSFAWSSSLVIGLLIGLAVARAARRSLLAEHLGVPAAEVRQQIERCDSLIGAVEALRGDGRTLPAPASVNQSVLNALICARREILRWTIRGTHDGDLIGFAATGKPVEYTGISFFTVQCGKIVEFHNAQIESLQSRVASKHGFLVTHHKMELYGLCAACQRKQQ